MNHLISNKSIFKQVAEKVTLFGEKKDREWLKKIRKERNDRINKMKLLSVNGSEAPEEEKHE